MNHEPVNGHEYQYQKVKIHRKCPSKSVGKIAQDEILYLMSRGLSEDEAGATIVRGFLSVDIPPAAPAQGRD